MCHFEHTHGLCFEAVKVLFLISNGQDVSCECHLEDVESESTWKHKCSCWMEYRVGKFVVTGWEP